MGLCMPLGAGRGVRCKVRLRIAKSVFGGMTYTWSRSTVMPSLTTLIGMLMERESSCVSTLSYLGAKCCTRTKAIPGFLGRF